MEFNIRRLAEGRKVADLLKTEHFISYNKPVGETALVFKNDIGNNKYYIFLTPNDTLFKDAIEVAKTMDIFAFRFWWKDRKNNGYKLSFWTNDLEELNNGF
jgi:hypothetical protein